MIHAALLRVVWQRDPSYSDRLYSRGDVFGNWDPLVSEEGFLKLIVNVIMSNVSCFLALNCFNALLNKPVDVLSMLIQKAAMLIGMKSAV